MLLRDAVQSDEGCNDTVDPGIQYTFQTVDRTTEYQEEGLCSEVFVDLEVVAEEPGRDLPGSYQRLPPACDTLHKAEILDSHSSGRPVPARPIRRRAWISI